MLNDWWFTPLWHGTASPIEIIWIVISTVGLCVALVNFHRSMRTLVYLEATGQNGLLEYAGTIFSIEEGLRVLVQVIFLSIGIIAVFYNPGETGGKVISWLIVLAILIIVVKSTVAMRARGKIVDYEEVKGG